MKITVKNDILETTSDDVWIRKGEYQVVRKVPSRSLNHYLIRYNTRLILVDIEANKFDIEVTQDGPIEYFA